MPDIIHLLPDAIANQIAAGEVVQRPASAAKELLENSIDSGATSIQLIVKDAGKSLLHVIDNGSGMSETDARMSLERHATSKIRKAEDLFSIRTMGFRGEALASIAAVSQMEMRTKPAHEELGTKLYVEGSVVKIQEPVAMESGTHIAVRSLFYNIPARRNFLKSNPVELKHIIEEFHRLALANPEIAFQLVNGDELIYDLPPSKLGSRIVNIFGKNYQGQLATCSEETNLVRISGYVGKPEFAKKTRGEQFLFVNRRFIKSNYLHYAVMNAFEGLLPDNGFPFYVLFIEIDPSHIDVNVHPTKTEIKFDDERAIYAVMRSAVRQAIGAHHLTPAIDFKSDVNLVSKLATGSPAEIYFNERFSHSLSSSNEWPSPPQESRPTLTFQSKLNKEQPFEERSVFQLHRSFIVKETQAGLIFFDQQAMHERILFEKFVAQLSHRSGESQVSLFPQVITFQSGDFALIMDMQGEIEALGFRIELFGKHTILVNGVPSGVGSGKEKEIFEGLIEQFKVNQAELAIPVQENLARSFAKRLGIKRGQKLEIEEMKNLISQLFRCNTPDYTPGGRPTYFIFELSKIESYFR